MFTNAIPGNGMQIIPRDITGPVEMGQRFRAEKTGTAAPERNLCVVQQTQCFRLPTVGRSLYTENGHVTDSME